MFVFMIMGSPPVNRMSETCERRFEGVVAPSRHRRDSCPSHDDVGGLFFDVEPFRTPSFHTGNLFSVDLLDASGEIRGTF